MNMFQNKTVLKQAPAPDPGICPAKTTRDSNGVIIRGCDVHTHLLAAALVMRALKQLFRGVPAECCFQPVAEWLAAVHDIGKVTPEFIQKMAHRRLSP